MTTVADANALSSYVGYYTDVAGELLNNGGVPAGSLGGAARVGDGVIPPGAQGIHTRSAQTYGTTFAGALGFTQFTSSAEATAVTRALAGGPILPVVFPVNIVDCETNGDLGTSEISWQMTPDVARRRHNPEGQDTSCRCARRAAAPS